MTYRQQMEELSRAVAELLTDGGQVPGDDIRAALAGHRALVGLLRTIDRDLGVENVQTIEVAKQLARQPRVSDQPLSEILSTSSSSRAGELWREVARTATLAQYDWEKAVPATRPVNTRAVEEVVDVAALAEAIAVLNGDIADSLNAGARWTDAADFRAGQTPLLVAARNLRAVTPVGPRQRPIEDLTPAHVDSVLICRRPADLPEAFRRLSRILAVSDTPPQHVDLISGALADAGFAAAATLGRMKNQATTQLTEHATRLAAASGLSRRITALRPGNGAALAQMQSIHQLLKHLPKQTEAQARKTARTLAQAIPDVTVELTASAQRQLESGQWLVRDSGNGIQWNFSTSKEQPLMLQRLHTAASSAAELKNDSLLFQGIKRKVVPSPRDLLAQPLTRRTPTTPLKRHAVAPRPAPRRG